MHRLRKEREEGAVQDQTVLRKPAKTILQVQRRRVLLLSFVSREQCKKDLKPELELWETLVAKPH